MHHRHLSEETEQASIQIIGPDAQSAEKKIVPPESKEIEEFQEWLEYVSATPPKRWDVSSLLIVALAFLPLAWQIYNWWTFKPPQGVIVHMNWAWDFFYFFLEACLPLTLLAKICRTQAETQVDLQLGALETRWVGPLAEALAARKSRTRSIAARALARLLPRLKTSEGALLDDRQRDLLLMRLHARSTDPALKLAILKAIERTGDAKAMMYVEPLASGFAWLPRWRRVRKAARACLAVLEKRQASETAAQALTPSSPSQSNLETQAGDERQIAPTEKQPRKSEQPTLRILFLLAAWTTILPASIWKSVASATNGKWLEAGIWAIPFFLTTQLYRFLLLPRHTEAIHKLAAREDLTQVGRLVDALEIPDADAQESAKRALTTLLPRLRASDAGLLNAQQRHGLYRRLRMSNAIRDADFLEAILKALEQVGDEAAVPYVDRLAGSLALTPSQKRIQRAAVACQPYLEARSAQIKASQTLLRASSSEADRTASLLRPTEAVVVDPHQLLRAASESDITIDPT